MGTHFRFRARSTIIIFCLSVISLMMFTASCHHRYRAIEIPPRCPAYEDFNVVLCPLPASCTPITRSKIIYYLRMRNVKVIRVGEDVQIVIPSDSLFIANSANFNCAYLDTLKAVSILLTCYNKIDVKISGYTDSLSDACRNEALSLYQAKKVEKYLWEHCSDSRMLYTKGFGQCFPIANNDSFFGRSRNRRIEITFRDYPHWD